MLFRSGYGGYIWPAYGVTLLVLGYLVFDSVGRLKRSLADLARHEGGEE